MPEDLIGHTTICQRVGRGGFVAQQIIPALPQPNRPSLENGLLVLSANSGPQVMPKSAPLGYESGCPRRVTVMATTTSAGS
jgi:hypothetical protein